jgi:glycosyltransferase involved in cell wall biosynthesis
MVGMHSQFSLVVPVYMNEGSIPELLLAIGNIDAELDHRLEVVFVVDGSPDRSMELLKEYLPGCAFASRLIELSRNFGSFAAVRAGLAAASGPFFAVMAADLQEPPGLIVEFFRALESETADITIGTRSSRNDPALSAAIARLFWSLYKRFVQSEMPTGGVDVFGCNQRVRDQLLLLEESNSSLVGLLFWMGFRRKEIPYERLERQHGKSGWTLSKKFRYLFDSIYAFSDLPVRLLVGTGAIGLLTSVLLGAVILIARLLGLIEVPGYAATIMTIIFFGALNTFALGVLGAYVWRAFENTKGRPESIVMSNDEFERKR